MASMRDIKRRIKGVKSTGKITKAMNLVSSVKLQRAKERYERNKVFVEKMKEVISSISENSKGVESIFIKPKTNNKVAYIVITSDRGLCGSYNQNIFKEVMKNDSSKENVYFFIGRKGVAFAKRKNLDLIDYYTGISEDPIYEDAKSIGNKIMNMYKKGEVGEVKLIYTSFHSIISQEVKTYTLLPVDISNIENMDKKKVTAVMEFDPSAKAVFDYVIPKYIHSVLYGSLIEASTCEEGSRMTAMDNATKNAEDIIDKLTLRFNRARQAAITKEISEIVGGANALN